MNYIRNQSLSIQLRILLLSVLTILPVIIFIIYLDFMQLRRTEDLEKERIVNTSNLIATEYSQIIEGARQLLITISASDDLQNDNCSNYLSGLLSKYLRYGNFSYADLRGNVICSGVPLVKEVDVSNRNYFKSTLASNNFSVGEYSIGSITNKPILTFGYPVTDEDNNINGVISASLDLSWLKEITNELGVSEYEELMVLDRGGKILARYPNESDYIGKNFIEDEIKSETKLIKSLDGIERLYSIQKIGDLSNGPYVAFGISESEIYESANNEFRKSILISLVISAFSITIGWIIGSSIIKRILSELEKVEEMRRSFVALVSHQLRTPLTGIKYLTEIVLDDKDGNLNNKQKEYMKDIQYSTNRLVSMVGTLLNISKLESGKFVLDKQKINIRELFEEEISQLVKILDAENIKIKTYSPKDNLEISADYKLIKQVVNILISNAIKYSFRDTTVKIFISDKTEFIDVRIHNTGIKILSKDKPHIFEKFFRGEGAQDKNEEGSGLGLYLSKLIIEAHGGKILLPFSRKKETIFKIVLLK